MRSLEGWLPVALTICCSLLLIPSAGANVLTQVVKDTQFMTRAHSPYFIREMIEIDKTGTLTIESGVVINFFPGSGITVRGALIAKVRFQN